jgi:hypothetical protein
MDPKIRWPVYRRNIIDRKDHRRFWWHLQHYRGDGEVAVGYWWDQKIEWFAGL